jgi:hypothetical protein
MSILLEINITAQSIWRDGSDQKWADDTTHEWIDGQLMQISDENFIGNTFWDNFLISFSSPQYRLRNSYGGYCEMQFGSFEVSQDVFDEVDIWPPPRSFSVTIHYTPDTESNKELLFEGTAHRINFDRSQVGYELYGPEYEANLLSEITGYASAEQNLKNVAATNEGGGLVGIPCPSHGYKEGDIVVISGSTNYEGSHILPTQAAGSGDVFIITATYNAETFAGTETVAHSATIIIPHAFGIINHGKVIRLPDVGGKPTYHNAYIAGTKGTDWHVYDDGVNIDSNVTDNNNNTFSLSVMPTGEVTICGTGNQTTLATIFSWACSAARLPLSLDLTKDKSPSPQINYWASSQTKLIDFLSLIAAWHTHLFYIKISTLYLIDMNIDNGTRTITEYNYFPAQYSDQAPLAKIIGNWKERSAANETIGRFIREAEYEEIYLTNYPYGGKMSLEAFQDVRADVYSSLESISTIYHKQRAKIPLPIETNLPVPGEAINGTDTSTKRDITFAIRARDIQYDFMGGVPKAIISGEGTITS